MPIHPGIASNVHATIELGVLLRHYGLGLVLIAGADGQTPEQPVQWVHSSELTDPTPFLTPRTVLLTTGGWFTGALSAADARAYVQRLQLAGITALGFGVGVSSERIPPELIEACEELEFPLFRVPYDTPFIAISQAAAQLLDARTHARDTWALEAQRAVATAALQHDGLGAALREAAHWLGRGLAITDRTGRIVDVAPATARAALGADWVRQDARELVTRGTRAGRIRSHDTASVQLQSLGRTSRLLGVLVTEGGETPDHAERTLLGLVTALATVQLEHRSGRDASDTALRSAVVRLLLAGHVELAAEVSSGVLSRLPRGQIAAVRLPAIGSLAPGILDDLHSVAAATPGLLTAPYEGAGLLICEAPQSLSPVTRILVDHRQPSGVSDRGSLSGLGELIEQADQALHHALVTGSAGPVEYRPAIHEGVLSLLSDSREAARRAAGLLSPIRTHDERHGDAIEEALHTWLTHHGQTSPAAAALGLHRHTLKSRIDTAESLLQRNFDDPDTRAEVWTALRLSAHLP